MPKPDSPRRLRGLAVSTVTAGLCAIAFAALPATAQELNARVDASLAKLEPRVLEWRRDFHQNPELSNREVRTSKIVAEHLKKLGLEVQTGVAKTGVVGVLKGGRPGPTIALRADMDALPVVEQTDVPFRSRVTTTYRNETVGVMHACGHDAHTAILMGIAEAFAANRAELPGTVVFLFQPAEEGAPVGEEGGASLMIKEGVLERRRPEAVFGLHVFANMPTGMIGYRGGPLMAGSDSYRIVVKGRQTHGARPWGGIDPIVVSAQIVNALQTVVSRQVDITANPAVVTVGAIKGGIRHNIVPDEVEMIGTIRTFDPQQRAGIVSNIGRMVTNIAAASGATATFELDPGSNPVVRNDPALTERVLPSLRRVAGAGNVRAVPLVTGAEDFAFFAEKVPSFFFFVGVTPRNQNMLTAASNHSPLFYVDEQAIPLASRAFANLALDYLAGGKTAASAARDGRAGAGSGE
ncbi:MAG: amidohydrolase [Gammaproteobacteria bacterium]|nr:amidohydrolase [Gammaproteobacteria bacterium]